MNTKLILTVLMVLFALALSGCVGYAIYRYPDYPYYYDYGITLMATFRSIMISMAFIISIMMATLIVGLVDILVVVMGGEVALDRQAQGRAFSTMPWVSHA